MPQQTGQLVKARSRRSASLLVPLVVGLTPEFGRFTAVVHWLWASWFTSVLYKGLRSTQRHLTGWSVSLLAIRYDRSGSCSMTFPRRYLVFSDSMSITRTRHPMLRSCRSLADILWYWPGSFFVFIFSSKRSPLWNCFPLTRLSRKHSLNGETSHDFSRGVLMLQ